MKPWERQPGESAPAYQAAWAYFEMGPDRSISAVAQKLSKSRTLIARWSSDWGWTGRAGAYDRHLNHLRLEAQTKALAEEVERWEARRAEQREREWEAAEALLERARQMMAQPLTVTIEEDDRVVTHPARWTMKDVAVFFETASKLARRAAEMETDSQRSDAYVKKELNAFFDKLKSKLPDDVYFMVLEKACEDTEDG